MTVRDQCITDVRDQIIMTVRDQFITAVHDQIMMAMRDQFITDACDQFIATLRDWPDLVVQAEVLNFETSPHEPYGRRLYKPTAHNNLRQWFSPSFSYIQIPAPRDVLQCGHTLRLNVPFTHDGTKPYIKFYYQVREAEIVKCRGL